MASLFSTSLLMVLTAVGSALDVGRAYSVVSHNQSALDSAVLAAGRAMQINGYNPADALATAKKYFDSQKSSLAKSDTTTFAFVDEGTGIRATSVARVETTLLKVVGFNHFDVKTESTALLQAGANAGTNIEISLMLDVTGSMAGNKIKDLKLAAKDLVEIVIWKDQSEFTSRIALAPFSANVNVGRSYFQAVTGQSPSGTDNKRTCVQERSNSNRYSDVAPGPGNYFDRWTSSSTCQPTETIMPLTSDKTALKAQIDNLSTNGMTAGHLGTQWAWYLLSPRWNSIWPAASKPMDYSMLQAKGDNGQPLLQKIAVLMTDGEYNTKYSGPASLEQARTHCDEMKSSGLIVYTVGFQISNNGAAYQTLKRCASDDSFFYNAADGEALRSAFRDIALRIATLRIAQ